MKIATLKNYTVYASEDSTSQFYVEHNRLGDECSGGLWFEGKELVDYDGFWSVPKEVVKFFADSGHDMSYVELEMEENEIPHSV